MISRSVGTLVKGTEARVPPWERRRASSSNIGRNSLPKKHNNNSSIHGYFSYTPEPDVAFCIILSTNPKLKNGSFSSVVAF